MSRHESNMLWLRDNIEHLSECYDQLNWTSEEGMIQLLIDQMLTDLENCKQICQLIQKKAMKSDRGLCSKAYA